MKKLEKWFSKQDTMLIIVSFTVALTCLSALNLDKTIKTAITIFVIPFMLYLVQNVLVKSQENNSYNMDLYMRDIVTDTVVWRTRSENMSDIVYLILKNTGKQDIFSIYIKVIENDGTAGWFFINDTLNSGEEYIVQMPYKREGIEEVVISGCLLTETRTKKFNGIQSGDSTMCIFSNSEKYNKEKYALYHEKDFNEFEKLERFKV